MKRTISMLLGAGGTQHADKSGVKNIMRDERQPSQTSTDSGYPSSPDSDILAYEALDVKLHPTGIDTFFGSAFIKTESNDGFDLNGNSAFRLSSPIKTEPYDLFDREMLEVGMTSMDVCHDMSAKYSILSQRLASKPINQMKFGNHKPSPQIKKDKKQSDLLTAKSLTPEDLFSVYYGHGKATKYTKIKPKIRRCLVPAEPNQLKVKIGKFAPLKKNKKSQQKGKSKAIKQTKTEKLAKIEVIKQKLDKPGKTSSKPAEETVVEKKTKCSTGQCVHGACRARFSVSHMNKCNVSPSAPSAAGAKLVNARRKLKMALNKASETDHITACKIENTESHRAVLIPLTAEDILLFSKTYRNESRKHYNLTAAI